jgi:surface antigen
MFRAFFIALPLVLGPLATARTADARNRDSQRCQRNEARHQGGGLLGGLARGAIGRLGGSVATVVTPVGSLMGDAIMNLLDCREQRQAANATEEATRGGVGTTSTWRSETRNNVSGSSTVTAAAPVAATGDDCMMVTDIVIVDGQEASEQKRLCRRPPNNRYVRV